MKARPRVLFLSQRFLFPLDTGGKIRTARVLEQLREHWDITLVGNYDERRDAPHRARMESLVSRYLPVSWIEPRKNSLLWSLRMLWRSFASLPVAVQNDTHEGLQKTVERELTQGGYELFVCDFLQSTANVPQCRQCPSLLFTHNVEARIARRHYENANGWFWRRLWKGQWQKMEAYEAAAVKRFDRVIAVSESDRREFEEKYGLQTVATIPTGVNTDEFKPRDAPVDPGSIVFCGSLDWLPNQDAVAWFVDHILPAILKEAPHACFNVIGRDPPNSLARRLRAVRGVQLIGHVDDVRPWLDRAACCVIPLRVGGGTRIKAYEALAMEKPLVSTSIGIEGLPLEPQEHCCVAETPTDFAAAVLRCLQDAEFAKHLGERGRKFVRESCGWELVGQTFADIGAEALEQAGTMELDDTVLAEFSIDGAVRR